MFQGLDPATGEQRCAPLRRADPRSKLAAGPLLEALKARAAEQGVEDLEALAGSKALKGDVRSVQAACRLGGARRVKVETVERLCRKVLGHRPARAVRGSVRAGLAASGQAGQRAGAGLRPLLQLPQERVAAGRRRQPPGAAAAGRGPRRGPPGRHRLPGAPRPRGAPRPQRHRPLPGGRGAGGGGLRAPHEPRRRPPVPHPRAGPERRPGPGRTLDGPGQRPAVRPADGGRSPVSGRRAGRAHPTPGCPLGAGGRTLGRGRDPRAGRPDTDRAVLQALGADRPVAGQPRPVRDQGVQRRGGGDQGTQGPQRVRAERLCRGGGRAGGAGGGRAPAGRGLLGWTGPSSDSDRAGRRAGRAGRPGRADRTGVHLHPDGRGGRPGQAPAGRPIRSGGAHPG